MCQGVPGGASCCQGVPDGARGAVGNKMAKKYKKELDKRRVEVDLEHQMERESLERAELRGKRKKRVDALKKQYEAQEIHLSGDDLGYGFDATIEDLSPVQDGCDRLCKDMTEIRGRKKEAMERHEGNNGGGWLVVGWWWWLVGWWLVLGYVVQ